MSRKALAFLGIVFVLYWFTTADLPVDSAPAFEPVLPKIIRITRALPAQVQTLASRFSPPTADVQEWLGLEASHVGLPDPDPTRTRERLQKRATLLKPHELRWLKSVAISPLQGGDQRFTAAYLLSLSDAPEAAELLKEIALTPLPRTREDRAYSDELVVRGFALEYLVKNRPAVEARGTLRELLAHTSDASLAKQAHYWLSQLGFG